MNKLPTAYFISHNGLGDNITNIGAVTFLLNYYDTIHFLCKDIYEKNIEYIFADKPVIPVPFDSKNEFADIQRIMKTVTNCDVFVSGMINDYVQSRITHPALLSYKRNDKNYTVDFSHIQSFYYGIGLDLSIYYEYFDIKSTPDSRKYYDQIKNFKIIFIHSKSSTGEVNYNNVYEKYKNNNEYIMICANKNMYHVDHPFYKVAESYVNLPVAWYIDIIKKAELLFTINSCFSSIIYPLVKTNQIEQKKVSITLRR